MNDAAQPKFFHWGHARRARFFHELASMMGPGALPPLRCLEVFLRGSRPAPLRALATAAMQRIRAGGTVAEALAASREFETLDIAILSVGERAGHLPEMAQLLGDYHEQRHRQISELLMAAAYPLFMLHAAIVIPAVVQWFNAGFGAFLRSAGLGLGGLYLGLLAIWLLFKFSALPGPGGELASRLLRAVPWLGGLLRDLDSQRFLAALGCLYNAGLPLPLAVEQAGTTVGSAATRRRLEQAVAAMKAGQAFSLALEPVGLPPAAQAMLETGEESGTLDTMIPRAAGALAEQTRRTQRTMTMAASLLLILAAVLYAAITIITMAQGVFNSPEMQDLLNN